MANIALNKPSGGQLILSPEDGTSTETVTIPSVGVGKVLQVVEATSTVTGHSSNSSAWANSSLGANITPTSSTSIIYGYVAGTARVDGGTTSRITLDIAKDGVRLGNGKCDMSGNGLNLTAAFNFSDVAGSTNQINYTVQFVSPSGTWFRFPNDYSATPYAKLILMEVAA
jgi:hypothetical protein